MDKICIQFTLLGECFLKTMMNVGIIGAGNIAKQHARAINKVKGVKLVAACRTDELALNDFINKFDIKGYTDYRKLLDSRDIDAVLIATPHHLHKQMAMAAASAEKHILVEKPFASTVEECDEIIGAVKSAGVKLMVGHNRQFGDDSKVAKEILDSGELGDMVLGISTMTKFWKVPERKGWHLQKASSGGVLLTVGVHDIDFLTYMTNSKVNCIKAALSNRLHGDEVDDSGIIFLRFDNGVTATIVNAGYQSGVEHFCSELICTRGMMRVDPAQGVLIGRNERWEERMKSSSENWMLNALVNEWQEFTEAILNNRPPKVPGEYARHIVEIAFAAFKSSDTGKEVLIN